MLLAVHVSKGSAAVFSTKKSSKYIWSKRSKRQ